MNNYQILPRINLQYFRYSILIAILIAFTFIVGLLIPLQANAQTATSTTNIPLCEITRSLKVGSSGEDVLCLQRYLNYAGFTVNTTGVGSPGNESLYFGAATSNAVTRWQNSNATQILLPLGLTTGTGNFGASSFNRYVSIVRVAFGLTP